MNCFDCKRGLFLFLMIILHHVCLKMFVCKQAVCVCVRACVRVCVCVCVCVCLQ